MEYDLLIIGGGTAGYATAIRASELGLNVGLVEKDKLGGVCLHSGCIPTKALLHIAEVYEIVSHSSHYGIFADGYRYEWSNIMKAKKEAVQRSYAGLRELIKARQINVIPGVADLQDQKTVIVKQNGPTKSLNFKNLVIATGSRPKSLPNLPFNGQTVVSSTELLDMPERPQKLLIIGGGYIGVEFASFFNTFGCQVVILEATANILPFEDEEIANMLASHFQKKGIEIFTNAVFVRAELTNGKLKAVFNHNQTEKSVETEVILVAVGREPVTENLAAAGIELEHGFIKVNERYQTNLPNIFAIGDVINTPQLAHVAFAEGIRVAEIIAGLEPPVINYDFIPHCIYSQPEVAAVGLTEAEATKRGYPLKISRFSFKANSKAHIENKPVGEAKIISHGESGVILGVHLLGPKVSELISEAMLITNWEAEVEDVANLIHPHPTLAEAIGETALKLAGKPLHTL